jgi:D-glycero-D-manno-heptose 1,7-bisphosphate phosphatase
MKSPAIFVDRDGTLIEEVNFLSRVEDLIVFPFTPPAIRRLKDAGFLIIVLTNQSGIGRGIYTVDDMDAIHNAIQTEVGGLIDAFYFCPHLPDEGCICRKPNLGMIEAAQAEFDIDMSGSWMIGDKNLDVWIAENAGIRSAMVMTGYGPNHVGELEKAPSITSPNFGEATTSLLESAAARTK